MALSASKADVRACPVCGGAVRSVLWLTLHRDERPQLWKRCIDDSIHMVSCEKGHSGRISAPLLLVDPRLPFVIFSPAPGADERLALTDADALMCALWDAAGEELRERTLRRVEVMPRELLGEVLGAASGEAGPRSAAEAAASEHITTAMELNRRGAHKDDLERALEHYYRALEVYDRARSPFRWATIQCEMAVLLTELAQARNDGALGEAIRCADAALEVFTRDAYPEDFALTQSRRASALLDAARARGAPLDLGIAAYLEALSVYTRETYPEDWALVQSNLATAYLERGDDASLAAALDALSAAAQVRTRERSPYEWALTQMNIGLAWLRGSSPDGPIRAIEALRGAYGILKKHGSSSERLAVTHNLALALARGSDADAIEAVSLFEQTRRSLIAQGAAEQVESSTNELAGALLRWLHSDTAAGSPHEVCRRALRAFEGEDESERVGVLFHELARVTAAANDRDNDSLDLARQAAKCALRILRRRHQAERRALALANLGAIFLQSGAAARKERERARTCFDAALMLINRLEQTPERDTVIGQLHVWLAAAGRADLNGGAGGDGTSAGGVTRIARARPIR